MLTAQPGIVDAAVVARRDEHLGQVPVAVIVTREGDAGVDDDAILRACRGSLAAFKVPAAIVRVGALPRTPGGKLRREVVRALVDGGSSGILARPGGDEIGWRVTGSGPMPVVLLPGTLSSAAQLDRLATELAAPGDVTVHGIDRRGLGTSRLADPRPLDVDVHVRDLVAQSSPSDVDVDVERSGVGEPGRAHAPAVDRVNCGVSQRPRAPIASRPSWAAFDSVPGSEDDRRGPRARSRASRSRRPRGWSRSPRTHRRRGALERPRDGACRRPSSAIASSRTTAAGTLYPASGLRQAREDLGVVYPGCPRRAGDDGRDRHLAQVRPPPARHGRRRRPGQRREHRLDLGGRDVLAAPHDPVGPPVEHEQAAGGVEPPEVARPDPAVGSAASPT